MRNSTLAANHCAPASRAARASASRSSSRSVMPGRTGMANTPAAMPARRSSLNGAQAQIGTRRARLQNSRQARAQRRDAQVHGHAGMLRDAPQQIHVAQYLVGFRGDRDAQPFARGHLLKNRARGAEFALGRLVRVGSGSDGNMLALHLFHAQVAPGERPGIRPSRKFSFQNRARPVPCIRACSARSNTGSRIHSRGRDSRSRKRARVPIRSGSGSTSQATENIPCRAWRQRAGEEKARRAMPTRSGADPGGSRALGPLSRWFGTSGNKVGVGSLLRPCESPPSKRKVLGGRRNRGCSRHHPSREARGGVFRFLFALSRIIFVFYSPSTDCSGRFSSRIRSGEGQVTLATAQPAQRRKCLRNQGLYSIVSQGAGLGQDRHIDYRRRRGEPVGLAPGAGFGRLASCGLCQPSIRPLANSPAGEWSLVIVNIAMIGLTSPVYLTLRELALAPAVEEGRVRARVLFVVARIGGLGSASGI